MAKLSAADIWRIARQAGFSAEPVPYSGGERQDIVFTAIALAESSGNTHAHNLSGGDNSYGLWQINMLGNMGPTRRKQFGISSNAQLFDPAINAKAAFMVSAHGQNARPWSVFTNRRYTAFIQEARDGASEVTKGLLDIPSPGDIADKLNPADDIINFVKENALRVGILMGGFVLVMVGLGIYMARSGIKSGIVDAIPQAQKLKQIGRAVSKR